jgi:hypothetical protein
MDKADYDRLRQSYKDAVDTWVAAIREEEALATPDHSRTLPVSKSRTSRRKP